MNPSANAKLAVQIEPYARVGPLTFGMSPNDAAAKLGTAQSVQTNRSGEVTHRYPTMLLTFDRDGLAEVGLSPDSDPQVGTTKVLSREGFVELVGRDGDAQECLGFVVLTNLGLTITGVHDGDAPQLAATAFRRGRWDRLRAQMKPFSL